MSSPASQPAPVAKTPFLAAAALFLGVAGLVFAFAIKPLGAAELIGLLGCVAAASAFATIPFVLDFARRSQVAIPPALAPAAPVPSTVDAGQLAAQVADLVEARLAAAEDRRRDDILRAALAARPAPVEQPASAEAPRPLDADQIAAPAAAKPRLGRGLASLIHNPSALAKPAAPSPAGDDERAAA